MTTPAPEGLIIRHNPGACTVVEHAPETTLMTLRLLTSWPARSACLMHVGRDLVWIGDTAYRVTGWDDEAKALKLSRAPDKDLGV